KLHAQLPRPDAPRPQPPAYPFITTWWILVVASRACAPSCPSIPWTTSEGGGNSPASPPAPSISTPLCITSSVITPLYSGIFQCKAALPALEQFSVTPLATVTIILSPLLGVYVGYVASNMFLTLTFVISSAISIGHTLGLACVPTPKFKATAL